MFPKPLERSRRQNPEQGYWRRSIEMYAFEMVGAILIVLFFAALIDIKPRTRSH